MSQIWKWYISLLITFCLLNLNQWLHLIARGGSGKCSPQLSSPFSLTVLQHVRLQARTAPCLCHTCFLIRNVRSKAAWDCDWMLLTDAVNLRLPINYHWDSCWIRKHEILNVTEDNWFFFPFSISNFENNCYLWHHPEAIQCYSSVDNIIFQFPRATSSDA